MASAKSEAMRYLGDEDDYINLAGLNEERNLANQVYNTNMTSYQNAYNDLLNTIANNRQKARTDFGSGRATVNENAFLRDRETASDLASRGLRGGIAQLNKLGNRMETGRQYSNLANTFYNTMSNIDATERTGTNEYNTNVETARNTLNAALADIGAREANARNAYRAQVAQLAEQIQARRAAQAQAAAARAAANAAQLDSLKSGLKNLSWAEAVDALVGSRIVGSTSEAIDWLKANTNLRPTQGGYSSPTGYGANKISTTIPTRSTRASTPASTSSYSNRNLITAPSGLNYGINDFYRRR